MEGHAPLDPPVEGVALVEREVVAAAFADQRHDLLQLLAGLLSRLRASTFRRSHLAGIVQEGGNPRWQVFGHGHHIDDVGGHGTARHTLRLSAIGLLRQRESTCLADGAQAKGTVRAHPRQHHADGPVAKLGGKREEEEVDRQAQAAPLCRCRHVQRAALKAQVCVGRDDVHAIGFQPYPVAGFDHTHGSAALQNLRQDAGTQGIEVLNDHHRPAAVEHHPPKELF